MNCPFFAKAHAIKIYSGGLVCQLVQSRWGAGEQPESEPTVSVGHLSSDFLLLTHTEQT